MAELIAAATSPWTYLTVVLLFGFLPGFALRLLVLIYPKKDPRRRELVAELYTQRRIERLLFVAEQLETVLMDGAPQRIRNLLDLTGRVPSVQRIEKCGGRHRSTVPWLSRAGWIPIIALVVLLPGSSIGGSIVFTIQASTPALVILGLSMTLMSCGMCGCFVAAILMRSVELVPRDRRGHPPVAMKSGPH